MENPYAQLFLSGLIKGERQWQNIPDVLRMAIKSLHDLLLQQQLQIRELQNEKKERNQVIPSTSLPRDFDSRIRFVIDEHLPRHPILSEQLNPLKMKTYQLENKLRQKANSLDVANLLKTKLDAESYDNQREQQELEWNQKMKNLLGRNRKEFEKFISERMNVQEEKINIHENQLKDLLPRFERLLRTWGNEKNQFRSQINELKQNLEDASTHLNRKVEVKEVSHLVQERVQQKAQETLKRVNSLFENERQSLTSVRDRMKESLKQFQEERSEMETNLTERLSTKVEIETVNSWIEKHTNELNSILKRIRDVELSDVKIELKGKVSIESYRALLLEHEKLRDEIQSCSDEYEKKVGQERKVNAELGQLKSSISGFSAKLMTRVSKVEYLQDLGKIKALVDNRCREIEQKSNNNNNNNEEVVSINDFKKFANSMRNEIEGVVKKYMTMNQIEEYFEERLAKLRKSIETLHRSIGQLLILNQSNHMMDQSGMVINDANSLIFGKSGNILLNNNKKKRKKNNKNSSITINSSSSSSDDDDDDDDSNNNKLKMSEIPSNILSSIEIERLKENDISIDDDENLMKEFQ